jgi:hypothetical protein
VFIALLLIPHLSNWDLWMESMVYLVSPNKSGKIKWVCGLRSLVQLGITHIPCTRVLDQVPGSI